MIDPDDMDDVDMSAIDAARKGMANLDRNDDDEVDGEELVQYVVARIEGPDVDKWKHEKARAAVKALRNHGVTEPDGQLAFPGLKDEWDYEPERLVLSAENELVEQHRAKPKAKHAEAERSRRNADRAARQANRRQAENDAYSAWAFDQIRSGAKYASDISFGAFVAAKRAADAAANPAPGSAS